jgi:phage host-nuclease inhibitor protein Gam
VTTATADAAEAHAAEAEHLMQQIERLEERIRSFRSERDDCIRRMHAAGMTPGKISRRLGLSPSQVRNVVLPYGAPPPPPSVEPY